MTKYLFLLALLSGAATSVCAAEQLVPSDAFQATDLNPALRSGLFKQKTNHFLVINDASHSMDEIYNNGGFTESELNKFNVEKKLLNRMNQTIPEMNLTSGLRIFGFGYCVDEIKAKLQQGMTTYSKAIFENAIDSLTCNAGASPLANALEEAEQDLTTTTTGNIAVIILTDAQELDSSPIPAVQTLKKRYADRLCIYPVWVGNADETAGQLILKQLADAGGCGFSSNAAEIASSVGMANFVQRVFLEKDDDRDGVLNSKDQCPDTPKTATVNQQGCWILKGVLFDNNDSNIKPQYYPLLNNVADIIKNNPGLNIEIQGHTDSVASDSYNLNLSNRRAQAVKTYLSNKVGKASALSAKGYGESKPVDNNTSAQGRANNRRVQLNVIK